jgi:hypothetical protein
VFANLGLTFTNIDFDDFVNSVREKPMHNVCDIRDPELWDKVPSHQRVSAYVRLVDSMLDRVDGGRRTPEPTWRIGERQ